MNKDDGGTAFPQGDDCTLGMSLRDYFAAQALPSLISDYLPYEETCQSRLQNGRRYARRKEEKS